MSKAEVERIRILLEGSSKGGSGTGARPLPDFIAPLRFRFIASLTGLAGKSSIEGVTSNLRPGTILLLSLGGAAALRSFWPILCGVLIHFGAWLRLQLKSRATAEAFERDYPAFLLSTAAAVRAGHDPLQAMLHSERLFAGESEIRHELSRFRDLLSAGNTEEQAISQFAATVRHPDLPLFRAAFVYSRRHGSSFAGVLQRLTRVTRNRQSFRRKISAAVALQKVSALGIGGSALIIGLIQWSANKQGLLAAWAHPVGMYLLLASLALIAGGVLWMFCMTARRI
ncbi:MAG: type II secretion system F family protein [Oligoflexia bacterium]|nr:type II secretion system F family protein [Oligoflexia bacterium]